MPYSHATWHGMLESSTFRQCLYKSQADEARFADFIFFRYDGKQKWPDKRPIERIKTVRSKNMTFPENVRRSFELRCTKLKVIAANLSILSDKDILGTDNTVGSVYNALP